jgi:predicted nucleic acid-binding Zn ribbon protein
MITGKFTCAICGTEYKTLEDYMACVSECGEIMKAKQKAEDEKKRLEKMNSALNAVKQAKKYYEEQLAKFEKEYPEEYKLNFGESHKCSNDTCKCSKTDGTKTDNKSGIKSETIELSYESDGKNKPKMSAKINGKEVDDKALDSLFDDPDCRYIAKMLGII